MLLGCLVMTELGAVLEVLVPPMCCRDFGDMKEAAKVMACTCGFQQ
jgi:hypothetical protein